MGARLLHLADLHLDSTYGGRAATRSRLRTATFEALKRAVRFAVDEDLDGVLIAGDAFDDDRLGYDARAVLRQQLGRLERAGIPVVYATGNHDPGAPLAHAASLGLGGQLQVVLGGAPRTLTLEKRSRPVCHVVAAGHDAPKVTDDLAARFVRPARDGLPAVALLHTQVGSASGADGHAPYAPSDPATLRAADFDYWALGHVHVRGQVPGAPAWYSGNLQGRNHKESGPKGGLLVTLDGDGLTQEPQFVPFAALEFRTVELSLAVQLETPEDIAREAQCTLESTDREIILRITGGAPAGELFAELKSAQGRLALEDAVRAELGTHTDVHLLEVQLRLNAPCAQDLEETRSEVEHSSSALREALRLAEALAEGADLEGPIDWSLPKGLGTSARREALKNLAQGLEAELLRRSSP